MPPTQNTIEQDILTEHRPVSTLDSKAYIEFKITSGIDEYLRLDKHWFYIRLCVNIEMPLNVKPTSNDWKKVAPVNNLFNSLFKQIGLMIGDRWVTLSHQTYPYKSDIELKLGKSKDAKDSYLSSIGWIEDNFNDVEEINQLRSSLINPESGETDLSKGKQFELMGKLHLPLFEQNKALLGGTTLTLKLIPNDPSFYMMTKDGVRISSVEFKEASLFIHRSKVAKHVVEAQNKSLDIANARYPLRESFVVPITINKGTIDRIIDNVHNGQLPKRAFVMFVNHSAFNGSLTLNPYNYQNFKLNYLAFYLNGIQ